MGTCTGALGLGVLVLFENLARHHRVRRVDVVLEEFVHGEGGRAHGALVRQVRRFQAQPVVLDHVTEQLPLVDLQPKPTSQSVSLRRRYRRKALFTSLWNVFAASIRLV